MKVYTFTRQAIVLEVYEIRAESESAAREILAEPPEPSHTIWIDWRTDDYELDSNNLIVEATP